MRITTGPLVLGLLLAMVGCGDGSRDLAVNGGGTGTVTMPAPESLEDVPLGDVAGTAPNTAAGSISNPYAGNPQALQEGERLFIQMNCVGCHGYEAQGGMGPDLTDSYWRYYGAPANVYQSIMEGRPKGMPSFEEALPESEIWKLVTYIESLGGGVDPSFAAQARQGDVRDENRDDDASSMKGRHSGDWP